MKKFQKVCVMLATILTVGATSSLAACGGDTEKVDKTKTQLKVGNLYLGYGDEWLKSWKKSFEEKYAETVFEEGKKGVQIQIDNQSDAYKPSTLLTSFSTYDAEVYFTDETFIYDFVGSGLCADITDIVTEDLSGKYAGETGSIADKMNDDAEGFAKIGDKYYMLPFYQAGSGLNYDMDLFYEKGFFISSNPTDETTKFTNDKTKFSAGVDGVKGTFDDGLPATFAQFYDLLAKMKATSVTPLIWTGQHAWSYTTSFAKTVWVAQDGMEQMKLNQTLTGEATTLVDSITTASKTYGGKSYDTSTVTLKAAPTTITTANAYELQKQAGKFYALQFAKNIANDASNYDPLSFSGSLSHTGAQTEFLYSKYNNNKQSIAMFIDSSWWRAEAKPTFANMEVEYGEEAGMQSRNFGYMPMPKANASMVGNGTWTTAAKTGSAFISKNCSASKLELAKLFLQFCYTNESLRTFTLLTESTMPYDYGFATEAEETAYKNQLTIFGQNVWDVFMNGKVYRSFYSDSHEIVRNNYTYFTDTWLFASETASTAYPFTAFHANANLSVKSYFEGLYSKHKTNSIFK